MHMEELRRDEVNKTQNNEMLSRYASEVQGEPKVTQVRI